MKAVFTLATLVGISMALPPWEVVGPESSGYGPMSLTQSDTDPSTLYSVVGPVAAGNYIVLSGDSGVNSLRRNSEWYCGNSAALLWQSSYYL